MAGFITTVTHMPAKAITAAVFSSGGGDSGSIVRMLANTAPGLG